MGERGESCGDNGGEGGCKVVSGGLREESWFPGRGSLGRAGGDWVGAERAGGEARVSAGAVIPGAPSSVVVAADLLSLGL